ncbi:MAG: OadG family transporter subunit [Methylococcales bacterium]|nr:OadG family transporter subunit [Methylococcales bacterium]
MNEMMSVGVEIMLVGMGTVFLFLAMLIVTVNGMSKLIERFVVEETTETTETTAVKGVNPQVVAAISTAVHQYRKKHSV